MAERATVGRLDERRKTTSIRDTSSQDVAIDKSKGARRRPWLIGGAAVVALLLLAVVGLGDWLGSDRSATRSQLRFSTVERDTFVRDVSAQGVVVAAVSPTLYASSGGISDDVMENALLPFYSTKKSGTGLGLPLCREIVEAHGGRLSLANVGDEGLEVRLSLPNH